MYLELTEQERALLMEILHSVYQDLREEVVHTDASDFKDALKVRETTLAGLLRKVDQLTSER